MKRQARSSQRGYSLAELLTVVSILGIVTLVSIPAIFQLMPQYRIRSAASELATTVRMARQKALTTRTPWRVIVDANTDQYTVSMFTANPNFDDLDDGDNWEWVNQDWQGGVAAADWRKIPEATDLRLGTTNTFKDVICPAGGGVDIIFLPTGTVSNHAACGVAGVLEFDNLPTITLAVNNTLVRYNRYDIATRESGAVEVTARKE